MNTLSSQGLFSGGGYGYGNQYGPAQEYSRLEQVRSDSISFAMLAHLPSVGQASDVQRRYVAKHVFVLCTHAEKCGSDAVIASSFQMKEAQSGYRQSGDLASKKRVRESINAALQNLPDWPPQTY